MFHGQERPEVQVEREGEWCDGELRAWFQTDDGWEAMVEYNVGRGVAYLERVVSDRVRPA